MDILGAALQKTSQCTGHRCETPEYKEAQGIDGSTSQFQRIAKKVQIHRIKQGKENALSHGANQK
jgi:hypothetical protein